MKNAPHGRNNGGRQYHGGGGKMKYPLCKLEGIIEVTSGFAFKSKDFTDSGIPVIKIKNITPPDVSLEDLSYVSYEIAIQQRKYLLNKNDVLIALTGSHINQMASVVGRIARVKYDLPSVLNQRVAKISIIDYDVADLDYIYYYLSQEKIKIKLASKASGAANQANISPNDIKQLRIPLPPLIVQRRIASILSAYDDLIENNRKQIKLLEEAAQRLYKEWFVDLRFPGHEKVKIVDGVPEGWKVDVLSNVALLKAGGDRPKVFSIVPNNACLIPVFSNGIDHNGLYGYTNEATIFDDCVTISARGSVGYACLHRQPFVPIVRLISVIPYKLDVIYLYMYLRNIKFDSNGAAQQQITVPMIKKIEVTIPEHKTLDEFVNIMNPIYNRIDNLNKMIINLQESRDRLLPKLMSGELEV